MLLNKRGKRKKAEYSTPLLQTCHPNKDCSLQELIQNDSIEKIIMLFGLVHLKKSSNIYSGFVSLNILIYPFVMPYSTQYLSSISRYKNNSLMSCKKTQFLANLWAAKNHTQYNHFVLGPQESQRRPGASC